MNDNPYQSNLLDRPEQFFTQQQLDQLAGLRRTAQVIIGAMMAGTIFFLIVSTLVGGVPAKLGLGAGSDQILSAMAIAGAVGAIVMSQLIPKFIYKKTPMAGESPTESEIQSAHAQYLTEMIIPSALLEGAAFFCLIITIIGHSLLTVIAALVCLFFLALNLPRGDSYLYDIQRRLTDRS